MRVVINKGGLYVCSSCGKQIPDTSKFCPTCGNPLRVSASAPIDKDTAPISRMARLMPLILTAASVAIQILLLFVVGYGLRYLSWQQLLSYIIVFVMPLLFLFLSKRRTAFPLFSSIAWIVLIFEAAVTVICFIQTLGFLTGSILLPSRFYSIMSAVPGAFLGQWIAYLFVVTEPIQFIQLIPQCLIWLSNILICVLSTRLANVYYPARTAGKDDWYRG